MENYPKFIPFTLLFWSTGKVDVRLFWYILTHFSILNLSPIYFDFLQVVYFILQVCRQVF